MSWLVFTIEHKSEMSCLRLKPKVLSCSFQAINLSFELAIQIVKFIAMFITSINRLEITTKPPTR